MTNFGPTVYYNDRLLGPFSLCGVVNMAGIWERIKSDAPNRISSHLIDAAFVFVNTGTFTNQQVINAINSTTEVPLTQLEINDLSNISSVLSNSGSATNKLIYLEKIKSAFICAEMNIINESTFRNILGIA